MICHMLEVEFINYVGCLNPKDTSSISLGILLTFVNNDYITVITFLQQIKGKTQGKKQSMTSSICIVNHDTRQSNLGPPTHAH